jgi:glycosyltransferase involved in cell wall biosynthesis
MNPRVAIAHDWMTTYAGSERCVEQMLQIFPDADLLVSLIRPDALPPALRRARPSLLQRIPGAAEHHGYLLPLMPAAWRLRRPLRDIDAVISSSHACANAVRAEPGVAHLSYCYTPMRYAWDFAAERERFPAGTRAAVRAAMAGMRRWDLRTADRVDRFVAISSAVAERIGRAYGRTAQVIHPPVATHEFTPADVEPEDYFLFVGRLVAYKRADLVVDAFRGLPHRLVVVGTGPMEERLRRRAGANVSFRSAVAQGDLRDLYRRARALVYPADEDFGLVMAEAQACGTPVVALARGGALDIVAPGETGWLVGEQSVVAVRAAVARAAAESLDRREIAARTASRFSSARFRAEIREAVDAAVRDKRRGRPPRARTRARRDARHGTRR